MSARRPTAAIAAALISVLLAAACSGTRTKPGPAVAPARTTPPPPADVAAIPDAVPRMEPRSLRGNPPFYEVFGKRYAVLPTAEGYVERGVASWYGPGFHAAQTSTGEPYDMYAMTAAHKTLPLPCYARVTNLANGRSVVVRVNDRGPFVAGRIVDLSYTAAAKLDMLREGTALVEVKVLTPGTPAAVAPLPLATPGVMAPAGGLYLQAGAFSDEANARRLAERLRAAGIGNVFLLPSRSGARTLHRVRVGPVGSVAEFDALSARLATLGIADARLALD
jgi:rare lipoprotein A